VDNLERFAEFNIYRSAEISNTGRGKVVRYNTHRVLLRPEACLAFVAILGTRGNISAK